MAEGIQIALWSVAALFTLWLLVTAVRNGHPIRRLLSSGTQGLCAIGLVNVLGTFTGVSLGFSWLSIGIAMTLGIPGVIGLTLLDIIMV